MPRIKQYRDIQAMFWNSWGTMNQAWVLIDTKMGKEHLALEELRRIPGVSEAHIVTGDHDILLLVEADSMKQLNDILTWNIRRQKDVLCTITMVIM
jgi:DNA-binding Lrp family transcriptional regulator